MVDLGCKTWQELAMLLFAELCNKCDVKKNYNYKTCESCPKALTIHRMTTVNCQKSTEEKK